MATTNNEQFTALELGVCSGNNLNALTRQIGALTDNYKYLTTEMPESFKSSQKYVMKKINPVFKNLVNKIFKRQDPVDIKSHVTCIPDTFENIASNGLSNFNGNFGGKADLIVASHCLSFCQRDNFFEFMQNLTGAVKDGGLFMGEIYLDKMSAKTFPYSKAEIFSLLQGKIDSNGNSIQFDENGNPTAKGIFDGFNVKVQMSSGDLMVHFIAEKTGEQGTTFKEEPLLDKSNPKVEASNILYAAINKSKEAKENRGDWINYAKIYSKFPKNIPQENLTPEIEEAIRGFNGVMPPRPLVESFFDSENGQQWLSGRIQSKDTDSNGGQNTTESVILSNAQAVLDGIFSFREAQKDEQETPTTEENPDMEMFKRLEQGDPYKDDPEQPHEQIISNDSNND